MNWTRVNIDSDPAAGAAFGYHLMLDLRGCDRETVDSHDDLHRWVTDLVALIGMKAYGAPRIVHFGHDDPITSGFTVDQLIETSNIMAHLSPHLGHAYVDIFSCRPFDVQVAADFTARRLGADEGRMVVVKR